MPARLRQQGDGGFQIDVLVGDVEGKDAAGREMAAIEREGLRREQVQRDGVAGEGVDGQHVEVLRSLAGQRGARVAFDDIETCAPDSRM